MRLALLAPLATLATLVPPAADTRAAAEPGRPNIILIVTDDQRWDTLGVMPQVRSLLQEQGTYFPNAFVPNSLCCPSRASILTGAHSHTTGVYGNTMPFGGFDAFNDTTTLATAMNDVGYRTMFVGKYLNMYPEGHYGYVPPGWDSWFAVRSGVYYDWRAADDGQRSGRYGTSPADYSGRVFTERALENIGATSADEPFFLFYAPSAPHGASGGSIVDPGAHTATPDPRDVGAYDDIAPWRPGSYARTDDVSDMPNYVARRSWDAEDRRYADLFRQRQLESLIGVDRAVGRLLAAAPANTLVVFLSDNGYLWGEHRRMTKQVPYEEAIRIPLIVAGPGVPVAVDTRLALNIDVTTTVAIAAGIDPATVPLGVDRSGEPVLSEGLDLFGPATREAFVLEHWDSDSKVPGYCGVRTTQFMYTRYFDPRVQTDRGFEELYDVLADPLERSNLAGNRAYGEIASALLADTRALCDPAPPNYRW